MVGVVVDVGVVVVGGSWNYSNGAVVMRMAMRLEDGSTMDGIATVDSSSTAKDRYFPLCGHEDYFQDSRSILETRFEIVLVHNAFDDDDVVVVCHYL